MQRLQSSNLRTSLLMGLLMGLNSFLTSEALADGISSSQFHFQMGYFGTNYTGVYAGSLVNLNSINVEYEMFSSTSSSFLFRTSLAYDLVHSYTLYSYVGIAKRYYLYSNGMQYDFSGSDIKDRVVTVPKWRLYSGFDMGISHETIKFLPPNEEIEGALFEIGPHFGGIMQINKSFGLELQLGAALGIGFSGVQVTSFTYRATLGGAFYF